jgi:hypothetical protein
LEDVEGPSRRTPPVSGLSEITDAEKSPAVKGAVGTPTLSKTGLALLPLATISVGPVQEEKHGDVFRETPKMIP